MNEEHPSLIFATQYTDPTVAMRPHFRLCKGFAASGWHVEIVMPATPENKPLTTLWGNVRVCKIEANGRRAQIIKMGLRFLGRRRKRIVVSFVWDWHCFFLALSKILFRNPYAVFLDTFEYHAVSRPLARLREKIRYGFVLRNADVILAETPPSLERAQKHFPRSAPLFAPPCFWRSELSAIEEGWQAEGYAPKRKPVILLAGRVVPRKNIHDLITAFSMIAKELPEWSIDIRGIADDADYFHRLQDLASSLGLAERVNFLPPVYGDDLYKLYRETSVFCLPSEAEGMPSAIMEAMYFGGAIVAANGGCMAYQLGFGECGMIHSPRDVQQLSRCLESMMSSPSTREAYMEKAKRRMNEVFNWEAHYPGIEKQFQRLVRDREKTSQSGLAY